MAHLASAEASDWSDEEKDTEKSHHFKSSFARSTAMQRSQSRSMDYAYANATPPAYYAPRGPTVPNVSKSANVSPVKNFTARRANMFAKMDEMQSGNSQINRNDGGLDCDKNSESFRLQKMEEELLKLRIECQHLTGENRRLLRMSSQSPCNSTLYNTQYETLQWQLRQTESSRQMYRSVMEQVSKFLERVHKNLDIISSKQTPSTKGKPRFPRSRSVHTVAGADVGSSCNRGSSPSPTHSLVLKTKQKSTNSSPIKDREATPLSPNPYSLFKECSWRPIKPAILPEDVTIEKLSEESFRLLRTVQSLLNMRDPDLTHRLTPSTSRNVIHGSSEKQDNTSVGSCSSLLHSTCDGIRKSDSSSSSTHTEEATVRERCKPPSGEDESGFSSMSSFQDHAVTDSTYPELGLPLVSHRRWNSTPVNKLYHGEASVSFCDNNDVLRVLWV